MAGELLRGTAGRRIAAGGTLCHRWFAAAALGHVFRNHDAHGVLYLHTGVRWRRKQFVTSSAGPGNTDRKLYRDCDRDGQIAHAAGQLHAGRAIDHSNSDIPAGGETLRLQRLKIRSVARSATPFDYAGHRTHFSSTRKVYERPEQRGRMVGVRFSSSSNLHP